MERIQVNNCIQQNTVRIPNDADTITRLKLIFSNEIEKNNCYTEFTNTNSDVCKSKLFNPVQDKGAACVEDISDSIYTNTSNFVAIFNYLGL